jgi:hypothetical protein
MTEKEKLDLICAFAKEHIRDLEKTKYLFDMLCTVSKELTTQSRVISDNFKDLSDKLKAGYEDKKD